LHRGGMGPVAGEGKAAEGYFHPGAKIGILTWDSPAYHEAVDKGYVPALKKLGLELATDPAYISVAQNLQDLGSSSAAVNGAVLKFSAQGIDHVFIVDGTAGVCGTGCLTTLFLRRAESQHYTPRYGFNDNNDPISGEEAGLYPKDQLHGSISVGWIDSEKSRDAGWHQNAARDRCYALMRKHSVDLSNQTAQGNALIACEELWFMEAAVGATGNAPVTADNFMVGVNALAYSFDAPSAYGTHYSATQHDGAVAVRDVRFNDPCTCYRYTTEPYRTST